jgi:hypothetical protein
VRSIEQNQSNNNQSTAADRRVMVVPTPLAPGSQWYSWWSLAAGLPARVLQKKNGARASSSSRRQWSGRKKESKVYATEGVVDARFKIPKKKDEPRSSKKAGKVLALRR